MTCNSVIQEPSGLSLLLGSAQEGSSEVIAIAPGITPVLGAVQQHPGPEAQYVTLVEIFSLGDEVGELCSGVSRSPDLMRRSWYFGQLHGLPPEITLYGPDAGHGTRHRVVQG